MPLSTKKPARVYVHVIVKGKSWPTDYAGQTSTRRKQYALDGRGVPSSVVYPSWVVHEPRPQVTGLHLLEGEAVPVAAAAVDVDERALLPRAGAAPECLRQRV